MSGISRPLLAVAVLLAPLVAHSQEPLASVGTPRGFELGILASTYHYEEPNLMELDGERVGISAAYTFVTHTRWFARIDFRYSHGELRYEGSGVLEDVPDDLYELRFVEGKDFFPSTRVSLSPYAGLGYRYLYNDLRGTSSTGAIGYRRYSRYSYIPLGLTSRFGLSERNAIAATVEYDLFLSGQQKSYLSDTNLGYINATNRQDSGYGYRVSVVFDVGRFSVGPWLHYWDIDDSDVVSIGGGFSGLEPKNWTREFGLEMKYRF